jgi:cell wall-associated NlpC family hydrolase
VAIGVFAFSLPVYAVPSLPSAGVDFTLGDNTTSLRDLQIEQITQKKVVTYTGSSSSASTANSVSNTNSVAVSSVSNNNTSSSQYYSPSPNVDSAAGIDGVTAIPTTAPASLLDILAEELQLAEETMEATTDKTIRAKEREFDAKREEEEFKNLVIARVNDYVNVRRIPDLEGEILGKLYDKSVGNLLSEQDGWYEIKSGSVTGWVKAEYCVTGEEAVALAREVGTRIATVDTITLKVRTEPSTEAPVLTLVPLADDLLVTEEQEEWIKVDVEEGEGYVHADFVKLSSEFVRAESREEEAARLEKEAAARRAAQAAANAAAARRAAQQAAANASAGEPVYATGGGSELGRSVANYALQFVGNPYRYGGSSLTNGADCSGFVMSVYANFGVGLPHSSSADRRVGSAVDGGLANAQPGDLVCYSGHVALYIGGGQIVHASTRQTGIIVSNASYRRVLAVRRIF